MDMENLLSTQAQDLLLAPNKWLVKYLISLTKETVLYSGLHLCVMQYAGPGNKRSPLLSLPPLHAYVGLISAQLGHQLCWAYKMKSTTSRTCWMFLSHWRSSSSCHGLSGLQEMTTYSTIFPQVYISTGESSKMNSNGHSTGKRGRNTVALKIGQEDLDNYV